MQAPLTRVVTQSIATYVVNSRDAGLHFIGCCDFSLVRFGQLTVIQALLSMFCLGVKLSLSTSFHQVCHRSEVYNLCPVSMDKGLHVDVRFDVAILSCANGRSDSYGQFS